MHAHAQGISFRERRSKAAAGNLPRDTAAPAEKIYGPGGAENYLAIEQSDYAEVSVLQYWAMPCW
jgi:hypothetical protein